MIQMKHPGFNVPLQAISTSARKELRRRPRTILAQWSHSPEWIGFILNTQLYVINVLVQWILDATISKVERWLFVYAFAIRFGAYSKSQTSHLIRDHSLSTQRWTKQYGWRELSPLECQVRVPHLLDFASFTQTPVCLQASFVFWKEIGIKMNIKNIPDTLDEFIEWSLVRSKFCHPIKFNSPIFAIWRPTNKRKWSQHPQTAT